jgi:hypothetical protein
MIGEADPLRQALSDARCPNPLRGLLKHWDRGQAFDSAILANDLSLSGIPA